MAIAWSFSHPLIPVAGIRKGDGADKTAFATAAPPGSQWAADVATNIRADFADQCRRYGSRCSNVSFNASHDSSGVLTVTLTASP